ncbi:MAG: nucleoside diphosphate kinase regulator [Bdellovibrionales bacterium]|nr:nucleoside diphosphate kinase regulator [Bdellovibrionales bacterium]
MERPPSLVISHEDFHKISSLLSIGTAEVAELLEEELGRAVLVPEEQLPADTVSMNSEVIFVDLDTARKQSVTLVYPYDANIEEGRISILAPVGAALIGMRVGQEIDWPVGDNKVRRIKVLSVSRSGRSK